MSSIKSFQTGPSSFVFAILLLFWLLISRSTWKGQAAGNAKKYWPNTACSMWCNHDAIVKPLTKHFLEETHITMFHHGTQKQKQPHMNSYDLPGFLRHFSFKSNALRLWCMRRTRAVEGFFSATQQQMQQVPGHCHYRPLGAVGIADTSILQLVLITNFRRPHGKVKLQGMPRPAGPGMSKAILCLVLAKDRT